ncbi:phage holin family protein [Streptomyces sp. NPDC051555]|uniref:phage holin family protein n=1 Tax=Streptomyces sp. NPDC051555 TaxID=3365657 RepID=UPI003795F91B
MSTSERHPRTADDSVGELVSRASEQISELVREEMQLARAELSHKGKRFEVAGGLLGGAGLLGVLAAQAAVAAGVAALAVVLPVWASALVCAVLLAVLAAGTAAAGRKQIARAVPPVPEQTIDSIKADVAAIRERTHR